jgi:hypothetical protein
MPLERREASALDVLDHVLDKGMVVDYWARVSVLGVDLLTITEARVVIASMDTYLRYAEPIRKSGLRAGADVSAHEFAANAGHQIDDVNRTATPQKPDRFKARKRV